MRTPGCDMCLFAKYSWVLCWTEQKYPQVTGSRCLTLIAEALALALRKRHLLGKGTDNSTP